MYEFFRIQWVLGRITKEQLLQKVDAGWITMEEYEKIIAFPVLGS